MRESKLKTKIEVAMCLVTGIGILAEVSVQTALTEAYNAGQIAPEHVGILDALLNHFGNAPEAFAIPFFLVAVPEIIRQQRNKTKDGEHRGFTLMRLWGAAVVTASAWAVVSIENSEGFRNIYESLGYAASVGDWRDIPFGLFAVASSVAAFDLACGIGRHED